MRSFALLFLLTAPLSAAPLMSIDSDLDHGACSCQPTRQELAADPSEPAPFDADAYLRALAQEVEWISARNGWRQRRAETRARAQAEAEALADADAEGRRQADPRSGAAVFGLFGLTPAGSGSADRLEPSAPEPAAPPTATEWFQVLPVDPATPGYAYTGSGGQQVGWRSHPVLGGRRFHTGLDLGVDEGTPIHAIGDATVVLASSGGGFGNWLILEHAGGVRSFYAHMAAPAKVRAGRVVAGQVVGHVGSTGISTAPHLHFEVWSPREQLPAYASAWVAEGAYALDEAHMPGLGLIDPARVADFTRTGGTPSGEGAAASPAGD